MFIASIVIPILIFYFYRRTKKERESYYQEWLDIGKTNEAAVLEGTVVRTASYQEKYYQDLYLSVIELWVDSNRGRIKAIKKEPACPDHEQAKFRTGQYTRLSGEWNHSVFHFSNILDPSPRD
ncbi:hypothetical protein [Thalassobacillus devorans]|uniref:hypothetical protein n=1 Tax=Thalassobacillus devorans TaxID=279813 RepID=UPI00048A9820|nr:hypothetical protein [Thalassobacillus devorans]